MDDPTFDDDEFNIDDLGEPSNDNFSQLRKYARKMEKKAKDEAKARAAAETERDTLKGEAQTRTVRETAKAKGYTDEQVDAIFTVTPNATIEQVEALAKAFPAAQAQTEGEGEGEGQQTPAGEVQQSIASQGFVPSGGGSHVPAPAYTDADIAEATRRGDVTALERMGAEVAAGTRKMDLKWGHLIED